MTKISRREQTHESLSLSAEDKSIIREGLDLLAFYGSRDRAARAAQIKRLFGE